MNEPSQREALEKRVVQAVHQLGEHFENVQIFCNNHERETGGTLHFVKGSGNVFARMGHVREWVISMDAAAAQRAADEEKSDSGEKE